MGKSAKDREEQLRAAAFFMKRANEAMGHADHARSDEASAAFYKEAETWLYMASQCLNPAAAAKPPSLPSFSKVGRERRSFSDE